MAKQIKATDTRQMRKPLEKSDAADGGDFYQSECVFECHCPQNSSESEEIEFIEAI
ncbi:MAG: hypothetical protein ACPG7F_01785 [Aggregatilineales bacterium]